MACQCIAYHHRYMHNVELRLISEMKFHLLHGATAIIRWRASLAILVSVHVY